MECSEVLLCIMSVICLCEVRVMGSQLLSRLQGLDQNRKPRDINSRTSLLPTVPWKYHTEMTQANWYEWQQKLQTVLLSIDEHVSSLDTLGYSLQLSQWDLSLSQLSRRFELIEAQLGRMETKLDVRMGKIEQALNRKDLKEDFSNNHLSRKIESMFEHINHKLHLFESKLDTGSNKLGGKVDAMNGEVQGSLDDLLEKVAKSDDHQDKYQKHAQTRLEEVHKMAPILNDVKTFMQGELLTVVKAVGLDLRQTLETQTTAMLASMDAMLDKIGEVQLQVMGVEGDLDVIKVKAMDLEEQNIHNMKDMELLQETNINKMKEIHQSVAMFMEDIFNMLERQGDSIANIMPSGDVCQQATGQIKTQIDGLTDQVLTRLCELNKTSHENRNCAASEMNFQGMSHSQLTSLSSNIIQLDSNLQDLNFTKIKEWCPPFVMNDEKHSDTPRSHKYNNNDTKWRTEVQIQLKNLTKLVKECLKGDAVLMELNNEARNFGSKITNMYNDLWKSSKNIEAQVHSALVITNATRREIRKGFHSLLQMDDRKETGKPNSPHDKKIIRKLNELSMKVDTSFEIMLMVQESFLQNCYRIQEMEPQVELKIYHVLDKMLQTFLTITDDSMAEMGHFQNNLKSHRISVAKDLDHITKAILDTADKASQDYAELMESVDELRVLLKEMDKKHQDVKTLIPFLEALKGRGSNKVMTSETESDKPQKVLNVTPEHKHSYNTDNYGSISQESELPMYEEKNNQNDDSNMSPMSLLENSDYPQDGDQISKEEVFHNHSNHEDSNNTDILQNISNSTKDESKGETARTLANRMTERRDMLENMEEQDRHNYYQYTDILSDYYEESVNDMKDQNEDEDDDYYEYYDYPFQQDSTM